jgi:hypothetical protein
MTTFAQFMKPNGCRGVPFSPKPDSARRPRFAARLNRKGSEVETIALNNGVELPGLGLGVFQTPPGETGGAVRAGLGAGHGILTQAWSPIGGITFYRDGQHRRRPGHRLHRRRPRQDPRPGDAALGSFGRQIPEA